MTKRQICLYWSLWSAACATQGWRRYDDAQRHQVTIDALGYDRSSRALSNQEFDRVKRRLQVLATPDNFDALMDEEDPVAEERKRVTWSITTLARANLCARRGVPGVADHQVDSLLAAICADLHDSCRWRDLPLHELCRLRDLVANRLAGTIGAIKAGRLPADRIRVFRDSTVHTPTDEIIRRVTGRHEHV